MKHNYILSRLCSYDPRNPDNIIDPDDPDEPDYRPEKCSCDNCFYGRTELAEEVLKLRARINQLHTSISRPQEPIQ